MTNATRTTPDDAPPLDLTVDPEASTPVYEQVRAQLVERIHDGRLPTGARLPTVRGLAEALGLSNSTVARVYRELETLGLVVTARRNGTTVAPTADPITEAARALAADYARTVLAMGLTPARAIELVSAALTARL